MVLVPPNVLILLQRSCQIPARLGNCSLQSLLLLREGDRAAENQLQLLRDQAGPVVSELKEHSRF